MTAALTLLHLRALAASVREVPCGVYPCVHFGATAQWSRPATVGDLVTMQAGDAARRGP